MLDDNSISELDGVELLPLATHGPHTPVARADILGIEVVEIPPQAAELVLAWLEQDVELACCSLVDPGNVALHVELRVARHDDGGLCLQQHGHGF